MPNELNFIFSAAKLKELSELSDSHYVKISMEFTCDGLPQIKAIPLKQDETTVDLAALGKDPANGCPYPPGCPNGLLSLNNTFNFM